jgi:hypothetical protein
MKINKMTMAMINVCLVAAVGSDQYKAYLNFHHSLQFNPHPAAEVSPRGRGRGSFLMFLILMAETRAERAYCGHNFMARLDKYVAGGFLRDTMGDTCSLQRRAFGVGRI